MAEHHLIDAFVQERASPPPMYKTTSWRLTPTQKWPAWLKRNGDLRGCRNPRSYILGLNRKNYAPLAKALGLARIDDNTYACRCAEHIVLLAPFANPSIILRVEEDFPEIARVFRQRVDQWNLVPAAPALHWSHLDVFMLLGAGQYSAGLDNAGWTRDPRTGFRMTNDPWRAAAYLRQATPAARARILDAGLGDALDDAFTKQPVHGPFVVPSPDRSNLLLFGADAPFLRPTFDRGIRFDPDTGAYVLKTVGQARPFVPLLHPHFRSLGAKITAGDALIETDGTAIADLIALVQHEERRGSGGAKKTAEDLVQMTYSPTTATWRTDNAALALQAGFAHVRPGVFETQDLDTALHLRTVADMASELAIEMALADRYAERIAATPAPALPAAPAGEAYSDDQIEALGFIGQRPDSLVADDMGLGKTPLACGAIEMWRPEYTLIVCMPPSIEAWRRHVEKWTLHGPAIHIADANTPVQPGVTIISDAMLSRAKHLMAHHWGLVIIDEVHRFKADDSARAAAIYDPTDGLTADRSIDLSGTPIPNRPQDLFNLLHHKLPDIFPSRETFNRLYGVEDLEKALADPAAARRRRILGDILRKTIMIRRLKNLPVSKLRRTISYEIDDPALVANLAKERATLERYEHTRRTVDKTRILAELNQMRRDTSLRKVPLVADLLADLLNQGRTPLVFGHHHIVLDALGDELARRGFDFAKIHGGSSTASQRQTIVDSFQGGAHDGLLAGIKSGGTSLTITRADCVVFIEIDWTPYDLVQAEDRAYRRGQLHDVLVLYVVIRYSVDNHIANVNNLKIRIASEILDPLPDALADLQTIAA